MKTTHVPRFPLLAALGVLVAPGCFLARRTADEPLKPQGIARFEPGKTTAGEVTAALGAPAEVVQLGRRSAYRYEFKNEKTAGLVLIVVGFVSVDERADRVWVFFDESDVLTHVGATFAADRARYAMPWERLGE